MEVIRDQYGSLTNQVTHAWGFSFSFSQAMVIIGD